MESDPAVKALLAEASVQDKVNEVLRRISSDKLNRFRPYGYQKEFFQAGADYEERLLRAGNRVGKCTTISSLIDTPHGKQRMGDIFGSSCEVLTYPDREARKVLGWIRKPPEECFRITMSDGQWFECPKGHLILTLRGYVAAGEIFSSRIRKLRDYLDAVWGRFVSFLSRDVSLFVPRLNTFPGFAYRLIVRSTSEHRQPGYQFSSVNPITVDGNHVVSVHSVGVRTLYDMEVEDRHNYIAGGMVHHNTLSACVEDSYHLTGDYPDWWEGKRFSRATRGWVVSITNEISRDILQQELLGEPHGTGLIPHDKIVDVGFRQCGIQNVVDKIHVRHKKGVSWLQFKCYEQGWKKFVGAAIDFVHFDEEPDDIKVYTESRIRIVTRSGVMYSTITPLMGETELMQRFMSHHEGCTMVTASMRDCPHLEGKIESLLENFPAHEREARMNGTPVMGEGRVFPYGDAEVVTGHLEIPKHWSRICGIDFGINEKHQQAACWLAHDREADIVYLYDVYKAPNRKISDHCEAIKSRGKWIPVAWPHDGTHREKGSGHQLRQGYVDRDVNMLTMSARYKRDKGGGQPVEPVVNDLCERIETGRFKVFPHCRQWMDEFRSFHRKDGVIQPKKDDALKASFYALMELRNAMPEPVHRQRKQLTPAVRAWAV